MMYNGQLLKVKSSNIPYILKPNLFPRFRNHKDLPSLIQTLAIQLMCIEYCLKSEVAEEASTPKPLVVSRLISHKRTERFDPGELLITIEEIDAPLLLLLGDIEGLTGAPLIVLVGEHLDIDADRVLDCGDALACHRIVDLVQTALAEEVVV